MSAAAPVVVVGAGQGGAQVAISLRQEGFTEPIVLVGEEDALPYQRPPLSKAYLQGKTDAAGLQLRPRTFYEAQGITLMLSLTARHLDAGRRILRLDNGTQLEYGVLVFATGARNRELPGIGSLDGIVYLRNLADATAIAARLAGLRRVVVVGGGFIGLEFAAVAHALGVEVTVVEQAPRLMGRAVSEHMSGHFARRHREAGIRCLTGVSIRHLHAADGRVAEVELDNGERLPVDLVLVGIGVVPNTELAQMAGLLTDDGIVVDGALRTSDPHIFAIGDCARFPCAHAHGPNAVGVRVESVQNAVDQARCVAANIVGRETAYAALPWFWTEQGRLRLQMAGLAPGHDTTVTIGSETDDSFSVLCFAGDRLIAVESLNRAPDHMAARRLLASGSTLSPQRARLSDFDLKAFAAAG